MLSHSLCCWNCGPGTVSVWFLCLYGQVIWHKCFTLFSIEHVYYRQVKRSVTYLFSPISSLVISPCLKGTTKACVDFSANIEIGFLPLNAEKHLLPQQKKGHILHSLIKLQRLLCCKSNLYLGYRKEWSRTDFWGLFSSPKKGSRNVLFNEKR